MDAGRVTGQAAAARLDFRNHGQIIGATARHAGTTGSSALTGKLMDEPDNPYLTPQTESASRLEKIPNTTSSGVAGVFEMLAAVTTWLLTGFVYLGWIPKLARRYQAWGFDRSQLTQLAIDYPWLRYLLVTATLIILFAAVRASLQLRRRRAVTSPGWITYLASAICLTVAALFLYCAMQSALLVQGQVRYNSTVFRVVRVRRSQCNF